MAIIVIILAVSTLENTEKHILADVEVVYNAVSNTVNNAVGIPGNALSNAVGMLHKYVHS